MPSVKTRRPLSPKTRFPVKKWVKKYQGDIEPKVRAFHKDLLAALDDKGVIDKFSAYLLKEYEIEATDKRLVDKLAFSATKDLKKLEKLSKQVISATGFDVTSVVESMTGDIFKASSAHAFSKLGVEAIWNLDTPQFKDALDARQNLMADVKDSAARDVLTNIRETVYDNGGHPLSRSNLDAIKSSLGDASESRARTIARTETTAVQNAAANTVYVENGVTAKVWIYSQSGYDRHMGLDGEEVGIDEPFSNGLMYPGDEAGEADQVINCMCSFAPRVGSELISAVRDDPQTGDTEA